VTLLLGNPTRSSGFFYDTHNRLSSDWVTFRVSCVDSPRVSTEYVEEMKSRYGEDSNAYRIRVLGEFPRSDDDTIISMELIEAAKNRDVQPTKYAPMIWGLDVARFGSDSSSLTKRRGNTVTEASRVWRNLDLMQLTGAVVAEYEAQQQADKPESIMVDSIGLGAGVVVSSRASDPRSAQQLGSIVVLPIVALMIGQSAGAFLLSLPMALAAVAVLAVVDVVVLALGVSLFNREAILTRWK